MKETKLIVKSRLAYFVGIVSFTTLYPSPVCPMYHTDTHVQTDTQALEQTYTRRDTHRDTYRNTCTHTHRHKHTHTKLVCSLSSGHQNYKKHYEFNNRSELGGLG